MAPGNAGLIRTKQEEICADLERLKAHLEKLFSRFKIDQNIYTMNEADAMSSLQNSFGIDDEEFEERPALGFNLNRTLKAICLGQRAVYATQETLEARERVLEFNDRDIFEHNDTYRELRAQIDTAIFVLRQTEGIIDVLERDRRKQALENIGKPVSQKERKNIAKTVGCIKKQLKTKGCQP